MKKMIVFLSFVGLISCQESDSVSDFTGNETTYQLQQASAYEVNGTITFKEKKDGSTLADIYLNGTDGILRYPAHLHLGNISSPDASVALLLNPVLADNGRSETLISKLADESTVSYKQLIALEACVKIHLAATGPDRTIILAGGNIGKSSVNESTSGRTGFSVCGSVNRY